MEERKDITIFEKHAQTILTGVVAALIGWAGMNVSTQGQQIAVLTVQIQALNAQISDLKEFARQPRFTKEDFHSLLQPYVQRIEDNQGKLSKREVWMDSVEKRIRDLEVKK